MDRSELVDIRSVKIDAELSTEQRMLNYLEQIKKPYCFLCDNSAVRIRFDQTGDELGNRLKRFLISLKKT